jgi:hypothetical protein
MRDFMDSLRSSGIDTGGPKSLSPAERQTFACTSSLFNAQTTDSIQTRNPQRSIVRVVSEMNLI